MVAASRQSAPGWGMPQVGFFIRSRLLTFVGMLLAMAFFLNPELLALGLVGDTAFFDLLALLLGLQLQSLVAAALTWFWTATAATLRKLYLSMELSYGVINLALAPIGAALLALVETWRRSRPGE